jgi:hypothetical protein
MYCGPSALLFVEYKYIKSLPKRNDTLIRHSLSELQIQWLNRINGPAQAALVIGIEQTALIIPSDFSTNISKLQYIEQNISRQDVAQWIYEVTHSGRAEHEQRTPPSSKKPTKNLGR